MAWLPDDMEDAFWFAVSPLTTIPTAVYSAAGYTTGQYPFGKPDMQANIRNATFWSAIAGSVWAWNTLVHPGKYPFLSSSGAFKGAAHILSKNPYFIGGAILTTVPVASVYLADQYVESMEAYAPEPQQHQTSWWRSVAQAVGAGGFGVGGADVTGL